MVFSEEQKAAIHFKDGPALVLAGPGSGKTTVIVNRIVSLIEEHGVEPASILVITFTKAAARSMKQRFLSLTGNSYVSVTFGTFHAVFFQMLRHAYNYSADSIIRYDIQYNYIRDAAIGYELEYPDETEMVTAILAEISRVKSERTDISSYEAISCPIETFRNIYNGYEKMLISRRLIDYDDMILMCYELLSQRHDYLAAWQNKYRYIMIDEFQDINKAQYDTIKLIAGDAANMLVVGDDDQSIYGFRGSKPDIMLGLHNDYTDVTQINLNVNYRCSSEIVATAGQLIDCNKVRFNKDIRSCGMCYGNIIVCRTENIEATGSYLISEIKKLTQNGCKPDEIAVISRTNIISNMYYTRLENEGISCRMNIPKTNIYDYWLAKDIIAYLRLAVSDYDKDNVIRIINKPSRYIRRALITQPFNYESLRCSYGNDAGMIDRINALQFDMGMVKKMVPYAAVNYILKGIGYDEYIEEEIARKKFNKEEVYSKLDGIKMISKNYMDIKQWLKDIREGVVKVNENMNNTDRIVNKENDRTGNNDAGMKDAVNIYTMHGCKGLEFKAVFIVDVCEGIIPYNRAVLDNEIEEERRLMYVAMTRAREKLYLIYPAKRYGRDVTVSRFIGEIDDSYVDKCDYADGRCVSVR